MNYYGAECGVNEKVAAAGQEASQNVRDWSGLIGRYPYGKTRIRHNINAVFNLNLVVKFFNGYHLYHWPPPSTDIRKKQSHTTPYTSLTTTSSLIVTPTGDLG